MSRLEKRIALLEAGRIDRLGSDSTPEDCCAAFGYTLKQAAAEFGTFPAFCHAMLLRWAPYAVTAQFR